MTHAPPQPHEPPRPVPPHPYSQVGNYGAPLRSKLHELGPSIAWLCAQGVPAAVAARSMGITKESLYGWRSRARRGGPEDAPYAAWLAHCDALRNQFIAEQVQHVAQHARGVPEETVTVEESTTPDGIQVTKTTTRTCVKKSESAARWLLERLRPEEFAPRQKVEHQGDVTVRRLVVAGLPQAQEAPPPGSSARPEAPAAPPSGSPASTSPPPDPGTPSGADAAAPRTPPAPPPQGAGGGQPVVWD